MTNFILIKFFLSKYLSIRIDQSIFALNCSKEWAKDKISCSFQNPKNTTTKQILQGEDTLASI